MIKNSNTSAATVQVVPLYNERAFALSDLLNEKEVAAELGIAPGTLRNAMTAVTRHYPVPGMHPVPIERPAMGLPGTGLLP